MSIQLKTPVFRVSYPNIFKVSDMSKKYGLTMLFSKDTVAKHREIFGGKGGGLKELKAAIDEAIKEKWGTKVPKGLKMPLREGTEEKVADKDGYGEGVTFANGSSQSKIDLVDKNVQPIIEQGDFYAGCYAIASISVYGYDTVNKGVAIGINCIQKVAEGEPFSSAVRAADAFTPIEADDSEEDEEDVDIDMDDL